MRPSRMATAWTIEPLPSAGKTLPLRYTRAAPVSAAKHGDNNKQTAKRQEARSREERNRFMGLAVELRKTKASARQRKSCFWPIMKRCATDKGSLRGNLPNRQLIPL